MLWAQQGTLNALALDMKNLKNQKKTTKKTYSENIVICFEIHTARFSGYHPDLSVYLR